MPGILIGQTPIAGTCTGTGNVAPSTAEGLDFSAAACSMYLALF
jgi:hypothetical protein